MRRTPTAKKLTKVKVQPWPYGVNEIIKMIALFVMATKQKRRKSFDFTAFYIFFVLILAES